MGRFHLEIKENLILSPSLQPSFIPQPPPSPSPPQDVNDGFNFNNKVSPSILLTIIILAVIFFISGLLHLLVRFLLRPPGREPEDLDTVTSLQGQLQQLFHLHDGGVDQSFIDTLPVFYYKAIIGLKDPFDCAVCLCEFEPEDKLRLLPKCSHAFHMECIDTWLLSHSTCPLCRASLLPDFSPNNSCSPVVLILESGSESSREIVADRESANLGRTSSILRSSSHLGRCGDSEFGSSHIDYTQKSCEILTKEDGNGIPSPPATVVVDSGEKVVPVKLGKFRNVDAAETSSTNNIDARRCFSMGSFEYVMDENSSLQVPIRTPMKKQASKKPSLPLGYRPAMSECDCESRREFSGFDNFKGLETNFGASISSSKENAVGRSRRNRDSFSISKIWLRGKKEKQILPEDPSRRAFSFRFPVTRNVAGDMKLKNANAGARRTASEIGIARWETGGSELGRVGDMKSKNANAGARRTASEIGIARWETGGSEFSRGDEENQSGGSVDLQAKTPSFARRTLHWLLGKQNKVVHSSFTPNI
ncbi:putative RING-H2 finger protein ATL49 [Mangifera indica]|uniref:putative RING-H2 finger protein ATL49 n=1 Tax=Mangifera indica TaxID=29780 RepID=UPI001CFA6FE6|nr:putative RING-H2 finger protein ATL49 [Mangifera indica]